MKAITLYTREGCHLCDEALAVVYATREREPFSLQIVDLDREASPEKRALYDWEVPVIELDGRKIAKYTIDSDRLLRLLRD